MNMHNGGLSYKLISFNKHGLGEEEARSEDNFRVGWRWIVIVESSSICLIQALKSNPILMEIE